MATTAQKSPYEQGLLQIKQRCLAAKIPVQDATGFFDDPELEIDFPAGSSPRHLRIINDNDVNAFQSIRFEI